MARWNLSTRTEPPTSGTTLTQFLDQRATLLLKTDDESDFRSGALKEDAYVALAMIAHPNKTEGASLASTKSGSWRPSSRQTNTSSTGPAHTESSVLQQCPCVNIKPIARPRSSTDCCVRTSAGRTSGKSV
jgi:hypothetical protein